LKIYDFNPDSTKPFLHLAHANGFPPETYRSTLQPLLSDYHVISFPARPLWGDTPAAWLKDWSQMSKDMVEGLVGMGIKKTVGIGHSLGGVLTLYAAVERPDLFSKIVLIDPTMLPPRTLWKVKWCKFLGLEFRSELVQGALRRRRQWESTEAAYQYFKSRPLFKKWPDETVKAYAKNMTGPSSEDGVQLIYPPEWEAQIYRTIPTDVWKFVGFLQRPTLVIRGEDSNTFTEDSEKAFKKVNPRVFFKQVQGAGHLVPQEKPEKIGSLVSDFLQTNS